MLVEKLDPVSQAARRGLSDLAIRNLFIIPTIAFLIVFNIFPLLYSLGYSFTDYRASMNDPAHWVGLQNYRELLADENIWNNFTLTAKATICKPSQTDADCKKFGVTRTLTLVTRIVQNTEEKYYFRSH